MIYIEKSFMDYLKLNKYGGLNLFKNFSFKITEYGQC